MDENSRTPTPTHVSGSGSPHNGNMDITVGGASASNAAPSTAAPERKNWALFPQEQYVRHRRNHEIR